MARVGDDDGLTLNSPQVGIPTTTTAPTRTSCAESGKPAASPSPLPPSRQDRAKPLRPRPPPCPPRWPLFVVDGLSSFAACTRLNRSSVLAARASVLQVAAFITDGTVIRRILDHLNASARRATQDRAPPPTAAALVAPVFP